MAFYIHVALYMYNIILYMYNIILYMYNIILYMYNIIMEINFKMHMSITLDYTAHFIFTLTNAVSK